MAESTPPHRRPPAGEARHIGFRHRLSERRMRLWHRRAALSLPQRSARARATGPCSRCTPSSQGVIEPGARKSPVALHGAYRDVERVSRLFLRQTAERVARRWSMTLVTRGGYARKVQSAWLPSSGKFARETENVHTMVDAVTAEPSSWPFGNDVIVEKTISTLRVLHRRRRSLLTGCRGERWGCQAQADSAADAGRERAMT